MCFVLSMSYICPYIGSCSKQVGMQEVAEQRWFVCLLRLIISRPGCGCCLHWLYHAMHHHAMRNAYSSNIGKLAYLVKAQTPGLHCCLWCVTPCLRTMVLVMSKGGTGMVPFACSAIVVDSHDAGSMLCRYKFSQTMLDNM